MFSKKGNFTQLSVQMRLTALTDVVKISLKLLQGITSCEIQLVLWHLLANLLHFLNCISITLFGVLGIL